MTVDEVNERLKSLRFNPVKNGWTHHDSHGDETYGLNFTKVQEVARELNTDACLADELYASHNLDLKVLATYIDDPKSYSRDDLEKRAEQLYPSPFSEKFCQQVIARSEFAVHFISKWMEADDIELNIYAYNTLAEIAKQKNKLATDYFGQQLEEISKKLKTADPEARKAMISALEAIGNRHEKLKKLFCEMADQMNIRDVKLNGKHREKTLSELMGV